MKTVKKLPKTAICFGDSDGLGLYATKKRAYLCFSHVGKFVNGDFVEIPDKKMILRFAPDELKEFVSAILDFFAFAELLEGKYVSRYIM